MTAQGNMELLHRQEFPDLTQDEFDFFVAFCREKGINPWLRMIIPTPTYDERKGRNVIQFVTTVAALRTIALSTRQYQGPTAPSWCGDDGAWRDSWIADPPKKDGEDVRPRTPRAPRAAMVGVRRKGFSEPVYAVAHWDSFAVVDAKGIPKSDFWATMPEHMLAIRAEALALRAAFPEKCADLLLAEEVQNRPGNRPIPPNDVPPGSEGSERGWNPNSPQTRFQFELALTENGLGDPRARQAVIDRFAGDYADEYENAPEAFYRRVVAAVKADPLVVIKATNAV